MSILTINHRHLIRHHSHLFPAANLMPVPRRRYHQWLLSQRPRIDLSIIPNYHLLLVSLLRPKLKHRFLSIDKSRPYALYTTVLTTHHSRHRTHRCHSSLLPLAGEGQLGLRRLLQPTLQFQKIFSFSFPHFFVPSWARPRYTRFFSTTSPNYPRIEHHSRRSGNILYTPDYYEPSNSVYL
mgnify:CR=1 FL=1